MDLDVVQQMTESDVLVIVRKGHQGITEFTSAWNAVKDSLKELAQKVINNIPNGERW
jgi:hypothetical protein